MQSFTTRGRIEKVQGMGHNRAMGHTRGMTDKDGGMRQLRMRGDEVDRMRGDRCTPHARLTSKPCYRARTRLMDPSLLRVARTVRSYPSSMSYGPDCEVLPLLYVLWPGL